MPEQLTGAEALIRSLEYEGVEVVFGMPGGAILMAYDPLLDSPIRHVLARHEQGAGHMASGYAHATGKVGVAVVTSGPAATNLLTALQERTCERERQIPVAVFRNRPKSRGNLLIVEGAQRGTCSLNGGPENGTEVAGDVHG